MSAPLDFGAVQKPWIEDLIRYGLRYNVEPTELKKGIEIMKRAVSNGDLWTAVNVMVILMGNAQSPPYYISPLPSDAVPMFIYVLSPEEVKEAGCSTRGNAETYAVVIGYCYRKANKMDMCAIIGWKMHWMSSLNLFFTEPMSPHELGLISKYVEVDHGGKTVDNASGVHAEEEGNYEAEEGGEYEPEPEGFDGLDLDEG